MAIPVANIYYLLCYAWDEFAPRQMTGVEPEQFEDTLHLFTYLLVGGVRGLHRRGFETGYLITEEVTNTLRGRILIGATIQLLTKQPKKVCCAFDEMNTDVLSNRILKATLRTMLGEESLKSRFRREVRQTLALLRGVSDIQLNTRLFHEVRLHQNNRLYSFLINICRFFYESLEAQEKPGHYQFRAVDQDVRRMRRIFEKFVRNFFVRRQRTYAVTKDRFAWQANALDGSDLRLLPQMEADVLLRSSERTIVIECKYTESLYQKHFFSEGGSETLRSAHLYQLCAYLRNLEGRSGTDCNAEGILLYPTAGVALDQSYHLHGHRVRIKTIDLNGSWEQIESDMLAMLPPYQAPQLGLTEIQLRLLGSR